MKQYVIDTVPLDQVWDIRQRVMYPDDPVSAVQLADDNDGLHLGVWIGDKPVSIVSLFTQGERIQFRKFATEMPQQGKGYGSYLLQYVLKLAAEQGAAAIWCNARISAAPFYERFGFVCTGDAWQKSGIDFIKMEKLFR